MTRREEEASAWFARMRGPDAAEHRGAFEAWRRDPANAAAYADAEEDWLEVGGLPPEDRVIAGPAEHRQRWSPVRWAVAATLFLALALGAGWYLRPGSDGRQIAERAPTDRAATATATDRKVELADGSVAILMHGARITAEMGGERRQITLLGGRARFIVAHDAARPFVVRAGGSETIALGTVFEVDIRGAQPLVHLISGSVEVRAERSRRAVRLAPGESAEIDGADTRRVAAEMSKSGITILQAERLALGEIVERANRLGGPPIRLADPELASRRVSGRFDISNSDALARKLAAALDLELIDDRDGPILRAKNGKDKKSGE